MELERDHLRELSVRLLRLHKVLLDRERHTYEARHGTLSSGDLLGLLLREGPFAWLRPLSGLIARIDELGDAEDPVAGDDVRRLLGETHRLLRSGEPGLFQDAYRDALQSSPDVVMAHAAVTTMLPREPRRE
jgi:hypothetical protein